jgi:hypothetical protein
MLYNIDNKQTWTVLQILVYIRVMTHFVYCHAQVPAPSLSELRWSYYRFFNTNSDTTLKHSQFKFNLNFLIIQYLFKWNNFVLGKSSKQQLNPSFAQL